MKLNEIIENNKNKNFIITRKNDNIEFLLYFDNKLFKCLKECGNDLINNCLWNLWKTRLLKIEIDNFIKVIKEFQNKPIWCLIKDENFINSYLNTDWEIKDLKLFLKSNNWEINFKILSAGNFNIEALDNQSYFPIIDFASIECSKLINKYLKFK